MEKKYIVRLSSEERESLLTLINKGKASAKKLTHARILLEADVGTAAKSKTDKEIVAMLHVCLKSVQRVRQRLVEEGLESALNRKEHSRTRTPRFDGESEAHLIALCCSEAPEGRQCWTMKLLAKKIVELNIVDKVSPTTVCRTLKKIKLSLGKKENGAYRPKETPNLSAKWKIY